MDYVKAFDKFRIENLKNILRQLNTDGQNIRILINVSLNKQHQQGQKKKLAGQDIQNNTDKREGGGNKVVTCDLMYLFHIIVK